MKSNFIKISGKTINLDNVTSISKGGTAFHVNFIGGTSISIIDDGINFECLSVLFDNSEIQKKLDERIQQLRESVK